MKNFSMNSEMDDNDEHFDSIETERLILREWQPNDLKHFAAMNSDSKVMLYNPRPLGPAESEILMKKMISHFKQYGYGLFACELKENSEFVGYIGLNHPDFSIPFPTAVEFDFRLRYEMWGNGYATEGGKAILQAAFTTFELADILSLTVPLNLRARHLVEKLGMEYERDFNHPKIPSAHPLSLQRLYRMTEAQYKQRQKAAA